MNLFESLKKINDFIESNNLPYMVFGGIATAFYGYSRQTFDIDIKINIIEKELNSFIKKISDIGTIKTINPVQFVNDTSVLPIVIDGVNIDLVFAKLPFEINAIKRARKVMFNDIEFKICTFEDLIIQKAISTREKDWLDIKELIKIKKNKIDWNYLLLHCKLFSEWLELPSIYQRIADIKNEKY